MKSCPRFGGGFFFCGGMFKFHFFEMSVKTFAEVLEIVGGVWQT
jgi:hypothetical protein